MKKLLLFLGLLLAVTPTLYAKESLLEQQIISCERIGYPEWRDDCFESLGKTAQNYSLCLKITNKERRAMCFVSHPPQSLADCQLNQSQKDINGCISQLKETTGDLSLCKKISDIDIKKECYSCSSNPKEFPICLEFRAKQLDDKTICDLMDSSAAKKSCLAGLNAKTTVAGCEQPQNLLDFKLCKQFAIAQIEEMKNNKSNIKKEKHQKLIQDKEAKAKEKAAKLQTAKEEKEAKLQQAKDNQAAQIEAKRAKLQALKEEKEAKLQQAKDNQAAQIEAKRAKLQAAKEEKEAKLQQAKDNQAAQIEAKRAKLQAAKEEKEARIQQAKDDKAAKAREKAHKIMETKNTDKTVPQALTPTVPAASPTVQVSGKKSSEIIEPATDLKNALLENEENSFPQSMSPAQLYSPQPVETLQASAPIQIADIPESKNTKISKAEEKAENIRKEKEAKAQAQSARLQKIKEENDAKAKLKADKLQKAKEEKEAKAAKIKNDKEAKEQKNQAKLQAAKEKREAQAQEKAEKIKKAKESRQKSKKTHEDVTSSENESTSFRGCTKGFGTWTEPPSPKNEQYLCDKENIEQFKPLINRCLTTDRQNILILSFDVNKDGCVTCADLHQWRRQVKELYQAKKRLADAHYLNISECQDRKF